MRIGSGLGELTIGLMTDEAILKHKHRAPYMSYEQREIVISSIRGVSHVIPHDSENLYDEIRRLRPDFVIHGDDQREVYEKISDMMSEWGGMAIIPTYYPGVSSSMIASRIMASAIKDEGVA
jgi:phosphoenolpyruvate phosphomutase